MVSEMDNEFALSCNRSKLPATLKPYIDFQHIFEASPCLP